MQSLAVAARLPVPGTATGARDSKWHVRGWRRLVAPLVVTLLFLVMTSSDVMTVTLVVLHLPPNLAIAEIHRSIGADVIQPLASVHFGFAAALVRGSFLLARRARRRWGRPAMSRPGGLAD